MPDEFAALQFEAQLTTYKRHATDMTMSVTFRSAREMTNAEMAVIDQALRREGWVLFKADEFTEADIPKQDTGLGTGKTVSQRMRAALFVEYTQQGDPNEDFDLYYLRRGNRIIEDIKAGLDDR